MSLTPERKKMIKLLGRVSPTVPVLLLPITYSDLEADDETFLTPPLWVVYSFKLRNFLPLLSLFFFTPLL